jgi:2,5-diamino-6-(ribosylamino)-4(3H)-pyrimidinone 5'-phosphate reductase
MEPYVVCHMIMSLDGRIVSSRWNLSDEGREEYENTAANYQANAWMCGRITMSGFAKGSAPAPSSNEPGIHKTDYIAPHTETSFAIALDAGGKLYWARSDIGGDHIIIVLTERVSSDYLRHLQANRISYLFGGKDSVDLAMVLDKLADKFEIKTLLLEGGGNINGSMLRAGLIDEISLLVAPVVDATNGTPALFDAIGPVANGAPGARWKLKSMERRADDIIWLRYSVGGNSQ